jgi:hypothetical protein
VQSGISSDNLRITDCLAIENKTTKGFRERAYEKDDRPAIPYVTQRGG